MNIKKLPVKNTGELKGRLVAVTGTTGGLGRELCRHLAGLGADLVLMNRSEEKTKVQMKELKSEFAGVGVSFIPLDLEDMTAVRAAVCELKMREPDFVIHNAGAYAIERRTCDTGLGNVFQINFAAPYYMARELLPTLARRGGRCVFVGSIAHNYSRIDADDVDFSSRRRASLVYGNAKRHLMYAAAELSQKYKDAVAITHPGISFTNITAHYPKVIFALIRVPMKIIFPMPKRACLSILGGVFEPTRGNEWIGPKIFNVWGAPRKKTFETADATERKIICERAEKIYSDLKRSENNGTPC